MITWKILFWAYLLVGVYWGCILIKRNENPKNDFDEEEELDYYDRKNRDGTLMLGGAFAMFFWPVYMLYVIYQDYIKKYLYGNIN